MTDDRERVAINIMLDYEAVKAIDQIAKKTERNRSQVVRLIINSYLEGATNKVDPIK